MQCQDLSCNFSLLGSSYLGSPHLFLKHCASPSPSYQYLWKCFWHTSFAFTPPRALLREGNLCLLTKWCFKVHSRASFITSSPSSDVSIHFWGAPVFPALSQLCSWTGQADEWGEIIQALCDPTRAWAGWTPCAPPSPWLIPFPEPGRRERGRTGRRKRIYH